TAPIDSTSTARVTLERFTPREIVWQVDTDAPRLLVASEVYYPAGWVATLDDAPTEIVRVNHLLRGVAVPEGQHLIRMRFDPPLHDLGYRISLLATLLVYGSVLGLGAWGWYRRGKE
ncbi:MAG: YfhO family protein, partial [Bacteroidota bacterium]